MSGKTIATIYFYLISAAALALIVIGIFNGVNFVINSTQYEKYPLRFGQVIDCNNNFGPVPYKIISPTSPESATPSAQDLQKQKQQCETNVELQRKQYRLDDIKNTVAFTLVGIILFSIHFPLARKHS